MEAKASKDAEAQRKREEKAIKEADRKRKAEEREVEKARKAAEKEVKDKAKMEAEGPLKQLERKAKAQLTRYKALTLQSTCISTKVDNDTGRWGELKDASGRDTYAPPPPVHQLLASTRGTAATLVRIARDVGWGGSGCQTRCGGAVSSCCMRLVGDRAS